MDDLQIAVAIRKASIAEITRYRGQTNRDEVMIGEHVCPPGSLAFKGFAGSLHVDDGLYHGHYVFRESQPRDIDSDMVTVKTLPGLTPESQTEEDADNGVHA